MPASLEELLAQIRDAVEDGDLEAAHQHLGTAETLAKGEHPGLLHVKGLVAWAEGDLEHAAGFLLQATDLKPSDPAIWLDAAELLASVPDADLGEAESLVRELLERTDLAAQARDEGHIMLANIRLEDDDPEEALEVLGEVKTLRETTVYRTVHATALFALGRTDAAIAELESAVEDEPDESELRYQLGVFKQQAGDEVGAREAFLRVLAMDRADDPEVDAEITYAEAQQLRGEFEDVLEELPDPIMKRLAGAPITVQTRPTSAQVELGIDPRSVVAFEGKPRTDDDDEAELTRIVLMRNLLLEVIDDDDDIPEVFVDHLLAEMRRFFGLEVLAFATGEDGE